VGSGLGSIASVNRACKRRTSSLAGLVAGMPYPAGFSFDGCARGGWQRNAKSRSSSDGIGGGNHGADHPSPIHATSRVSALTDALSEAGNSTHASTSVSASVCASASTCRSRDGRRGMAQAAGVWCMQAGQEQKGVQLAQQVQLEGGAAGTWPAQCSARPSFRLVWSISPHAVAFNPVFETWLEGIALSNFFSFSAFVRYVSPAS